MGRNIGQLFKLIDVMSEAPALNANGQSRFKSTGGAWCTLFALVAIIGYSGFAIHEYTQWIVVGVSKRADPVDSLPLIDLKEARLFPLIASFAVEENNKTMDDIYDYIYPSFEYPVLIDQEIKIWSAPMVPCKNLSLELFLKYYPLKDGADYYEENSKFILCVDFRKVEKELAKNGTKPFVLLEGEEATIKFYPCDPKISKNCTSLTEETRAEMFTYLDLNLLYIGRQLYTNNFEDPVRYHHVEKHHSFYLKANEMQVMTSEIGAALVEDHFGWPYRALNSSTYLTVERLKQHTKAVEDQDLFCTKQQRLSNDAEDECFEYVKINLSLGSRKELQVYSRRFKTLLDIIGAIGGFKTIIWLLASFSYQFWSGIVCRYTISKKVFGVQSSPFDWCCLRKKKEVDMSEFLRDPNVKVELSASSPLVASAIESVDQFLDVYWLVGQLALLRILVSCMIDGRTQALGPKAMLCLRFLDDDPRALDSPFVPLARDRENVIEHNDFEIPSDQSTSKPAPKTLIIEEGDYLLKKADQGVSGTGPSLDPVQVRVAVQNTVKAYQDDIFLQVQTARLDSGRQSMQPAQVGDGALATSLMEDSHD